MKFVRVSTWYLLVLTLVVAVHIACGGRDQQRSRGEHKVELDSLRKAVLEDSDDALLQAEEIGSPAMPVLLELLKNENPETRELALSCVVLTDDESVPTVLVEALWDKDAQVRASALQSIRSRISSAILQGLIANLSNTDAVVRGGVARLIGRIDDASAMKPLRKQLDQEDDANVGKQIKLAMARLGDEEFKNEFASQIDTPPLEGRYDVILALEYISDKRLASRLLPALADTSDAYDIGHPEADPEFARVCDAAINLIAVWYDRPFSFETDEFLIYSEGQVKEAERFIRSLEK
ncbi:MAG: HEAT repeat domain-containing protein [candidate division Zixibacteria bacterium]|nr:HEAT repeat domain-containing protein [candidate division Zixibacteria bacterium]MBU1471976.1 HEAT repeat domain-containing protein [candidate division Zixibacteria bacterium]MBU2626923.1 HEAT repeat domain-containing protein [candidate division Zixibacteria bacterium]